MRIQVFFKAGSLGALRNEVLHHGLEVWATSASQSLWCGSSRAERVFWVWRTRLQRSELPARRRVAAARRPSLAASARERVFCLSSGGDRGWSPLGDSDRGRRVRVLCPEAAQWAKFSRAFGWVLHVSEDTHSSQFSRNLFEPVLFSEGVSEPAECGHASSQSTSPDAQRVLAS